MMNNRDYSRSDLAAAHVRHGEKLRSNLERAQGELDRREAILQLLADGHRIRRRMGSIYVRIRCCRRCEKSTTAGRFFR